MEQYIKKSAVVAEIKRRRDLHYKHYVKKGAGSISECKYEEDRDILDFLDTLKVKEVDLEKELESWRHNHFHGRRDKEASGEYLERSSQLDLAKHFLELDLNASNPITEENLESLVREVIDLYLEAGKHYDSVIKEERKKYGGSDLAIKLLDGVIDAEELGIQYVLDKLKLKEQKGE